MASLALAFSILARDAGASKTFNKVGDAAEKTGKKVGGLSKRSAAAGAAIGGLAAGGMAAGLSAVKNFAAGSVDAFAAVEDATGAAGVQFGKALPQVLKFAENAGKSFGLSKRAALDAQNTFGTLGKSAGLAGKPLADFSGKFAGLAGDLASFKGTSTEQAIEAVGAALRGESEPIRAYGVLLDDASLRQEALSQGLIKTTKQALTPQQKVLATQALILKQTSDAQGDYARTSTSTANTQKTLQAETENASAALGERLAPIVTSIRQKFLQFIVALSDTNGSFQQKVLPALAQAGKALKSTAKFVSDNFNVIGPLVVVLGSFAAAVFVITKAAKAYTAVQAALNVVLAANPIGLIIIAVAGLAAGLVIAYKKSETFRIIVNKAFSSVLTGVDKLLGGIEGLFRALGNVPGFGWAKTAADNIGKAREKTAALKRALDAIPSKKAITVAFGVTGTDRLRDAALAARSAGDGPGRGGRMLSRVSKLIAGTNLSVSSTYRTPARNRAVGGSPTSYHLDRNNPAVDVVGPASQLDRLHAQLRAAGGLRELLWRTAGHFDHLHAADLGGVFKGPGFVKMGPGYETFASGLRPAEKVASLPAGNSGPEIHIHIAGHVVGVRDLTREIQTQLLANGRR